MALRLAGLMISPKPRGGALGWEKLSVTANYRHTLETCEFGSRLPQ